MDLLQKMKALAAEPAPKEVTENDAAAISRANRMKRAQLLLARDRSVAAENKIQKAWTPPKLVAPTRDGSEVDEDLSTLTSLGKIETDAALFVFQEEERNNDAVKLHHILRMPSSLPEVGKTTENSSSSVFNVLMVDVSGSMNRYWESVMDGWNNHVAPKITGETVIYTFSSSVTFRGLGSTLEKKYFDAGGTDLTGAFQTIVNEVYQCKQKYVNVYLITDGDHNSTEVQPSSVIDVMEYPPGKVCNVYILGIGCDFPVEYSVDIRSRLHSGSPNVPSLFWAKNVDSVVGELEDISEIVYNEACFTAKLSLAGSLLPGLSQRNVFHKSEWVYMPYQPEKLKELEIIFNKHVGTLFLEPQEGTVEVLKEVFCQWNSIIIQRHRKGKTIPDGILEFKERLFRPRVKTTDHGKKSIRQRIQNKELKAHDMQFRQELAQLKAILIKEKFENPLELAENILSTTVTRSKYKTRSLQLKGHTDEDYTADSQAFLKVRSENLEKLKTIEETPDDCCRVSLTSTITDLQDPDFPEMLRDYDKYSFLKSFTITGIPVFAPVRDSVALNPWSYSVKKMLRSPYTIMSQVVQESFGDYREPKGDHKMVQVKEDDEGSSFNAIVPVFSAKNVKVMTPFVKTRLYTMCVTFAITKNPHLIDFNIHIAALAATWVKCLHENPTLPRAEHALLRMESIEATAALYMDEKRHANYCTSLIDDTPQALMTEGTVKVGNATLKCESIVKPVFFLLMMKKSLGTLDSVKILDIMRLILVEYAGRCLPSYKVGDNSSKPYSYFFAESFADENDRREWVINYIEEMESEIYGNNRELLEQFYTLENVSKAAKKVADTKVVELNENLSCKIPLKINMRRVERLRNVSSAGDISWPTLKIFAHHIGLDQEQVDSLFSEESVFIYISHALRYRQSRDRLSNPMDNFAESYAFVLSKVTDECSRDVIDKFRSELVSIMEESWLKAYFDAHSETVQPMTRQQVITEAQRRGIEVSEDTFDQVYKRFRPTGLLSNACQTRACPYFLQPRKTYNQHASVERKKGVGVFVHGLHKASHAHRAEDVDEIISVISSGSLTNKRTPIPEDAVRNLSSEIGFLKVRYQEMIIE
ncbi:uncharacterized protein LOC135218252 [Macrobrachium nipponense]|uniref:uncharacterized protein LOC135218252 n=1 Tax=Macrobrachium nipponense TaxID=159736 RepID=UPI0030C8A523